MVKILVKRAFFGKGNCFKFLLYDNNTVFFHFGIENKAWQWKKVKMGDVELGEILNVLEGRKENVSFFHNFGDEKTQIWVNRKKDGFFIKVKEMSKAFNDGEQRVLESLIRHAIVRMNMVF